MRSPNHTYRVNKAMRGSSSDEYFDSLLEEVDRVRRQKDAEQTGALQAPAPIDLSRSLPPTLVELFHDIAMSFNGKFRHITNSELDEAKVSSGLLESDSYRQRAPSEVKYRIKQDEKKIKPEKNYWYQTIMLGQLNSSLSVAPIASKVLVALLNMMQAENSSGHFFTIKTSSIMQNTKSLLIIREAGTESPIQLYNKKYLFYSLRREDGFFMLTFDSEENRSKARKEIQKRLNSQEIMTGCSSSTVSLFHPESKYYPSDCSLISILPSDECQSVVEKQEYIQRAKKRWADTISDQKLKDQVTKGLGKTVEELAMLIEKHPECDSDSKNRYLFQLKELAKHLEEYFRSPDWEAKIQRRLEEKDTYQLTGSELLRKATWILWSPNTKKQQAQAQAPATPLAKIRIFHTPDESWTVTGSNDPKPGLNFKARPFQPK